jgi:predicted MFS family arabinose efflux permease
MVMVTGVAATSGGLFTDRFGYGAVFATASLQTLLALVPAMLFFRQSGYRRRSTTT